MARRSARLALKAHSPFSELSVELQIAVLGNLPVRDLVAARFVSTTFSSLIAKSPELWRHQKVDLQEYIYRERFEFDERVDSLALFMQHGGLDALHTVDLSIDPIYALVKISHALSGLVRTLQHVENITDLVFCVYLSNPQHAIDALGAAQPPVKRLTIAVYPDETRRGEKKLPDPAPYRSALGALFPNVVDISLWRAQLSYSPRDREWMEAEK